MAELPYSAGPWEFDAPGGETTCVELRVPHRGVIRTIRLNQCDGDEVAADFALYASRNACPPGSESSEAAAGPCGGKEMFNVFGTKQRVASTPFLEFEKQYPYVNKDGTPTNPQRKLYLRITPEGSGDKSWSFGLEIETPTPI